MGRGGGRVGEGERSGEGRGKYASLALGGMDATDYILDYTCISSGLFVFSIQSQKRYSLRVQCKLRLTIDKKFDTLLSKKASVVDVWLTVRNALYSHGTAP